MSSVTALLGVWVLLTLLFVFYILINYCWTSPLYVYIRYYNLGFSYVHQAQTKIKGNKSLMFTRMFPLVSFCMYSHFLLVLDTVGKE